MVFWVHPGNCSGLVSITVSGEAHWVKFLPLIPEDQGSNPACGDLLIIARLSQNIDPAELEQLKCPNYYGHYRQPWVVPVADPVTTAVAYRGRQNLLNLLQPWLQSCHSLLPSRTQIKHFLIYLFLRDMMGALAPFCITRQLSCSPSNCAKLAYIIFLLTGWKHTWAIVLEYQPREWHISKTPNISILVRPDGPFFFFLF